ncbi:MAG: hypothetical protein H7062_10855, partial [Candidatus Saccharimonas sp.]|nr:hypothetical protein [Planctomycetaceae bacterium]
MAVIAPNKKTSPSKALGLHQLADLELSHMERTTEWSLTGAKRAIVVAGCLAAVYTQLTTSPA